MSLLFLLLPQPRQPRAILHHSQQHAAPLLIPKVWQAPSDTCPVSKVSCSKIDTFVFNASLAYECLTSVPFNPAVATRFLQYYNDTLKFQSTLAYLKSPPSSYQQPGVDLLAGLEQLQQGINNGIFPNQYEFEAALGRLLYAAHDGHVNLIAGILAAFSFASPYDIVSVSIDGVQIPKVYLAIDLDTSNFFASYIPSAITSINGIDATTYLDDFAANNSFGTLEPHADWNQLMESAALEYGQYFFKKHLFLIPNPTSPDSPMSELCSKIKMNIFYLF